MLRPLSRDPYYRAGVMGLLFCIVMGLIRREPVFVLGGGFFAALLYSSCRDYWKAKKAEVAKSRKQKSLFSDDGKR